MSYLLQNIKLTIGEFKKHWSVPKEGRYVPHKEIVAYGVGGMGVHFATTIAGVAALSASNFMVGSCIGLQPMHLYWMQIIANVFAIFVTMVRSYCFDNTKSKDGKFRPYLKWTGIPMVIFSIIFVWLPYENMGYSSKIIAVEILFLLINCFSPFYSEAFALLLQVISPDSDERTDIMSIGQIIYSLAPSITNLIIPFLAVWLFDGLTDIRTYRFIYPIISIIGLFIAFPVYKYTRERIIKPKSQENGVRFFDAVRSIARNKYFWIYNSATWIGFLESAYTVILGWSFVYAFPDKQQYLGVANTLIGNGALWAMMAAPFLIRLLGKRNLLIWCNVVNILLLALLYPFYDNIWMLILIFYANNFVGVLSNIYGPGINADIKDYQQYVTGERIDGMFKAMEQIGTIIAFGTGAVVPFLYELCGLKDDYDVLYDADVRGHLFKVLIIASVAGAVMNVVPFLFYDLTEKKHRGIVNILHIRAMFSDFSYNDLSDDTLMRGMTVINNARECQNSSQTPISKEDLIRAKRMPHKTDDEKRLRRDAVKQARAAIHMQKLHNLDVELAPVIMQELCKFETVRYRKQTERAALMVEKSERPLSEIENWLKQEAKRIGKESQESKEIHSDIADEIRCVKSAARLRKRYYAGGIIEPEDDILHLAQQMPTATISQFIKRKLAISRALKKISIYKRAMLPFTNAKRLLSEKDAYARLNELEQLYDRLVRESADSKASSEAVM